MENQFQILKGNNGETWKVPRSINFIEHNSMKLEEIVNKKMNGNNEKIQDFSIINQR